MRLEVGAQWSVADQDQAHTALRVSRLQGVEGFDQQTEILLCRQATYMQHGQVIRPQAPAFAQGVAASAWVEQLAVDATGKQGQALEITALKIDLLADARHQRHLRAVVEPAQVVGHRSGQQADAVVPGVLLEIGVKTATTGIARRLAARKADRPSGPSVAM